MPSVIAPSKIIHHHLQTNTVAGEVTINLNLTITINQDGTVQVASTPESSKGNSEKHIPDMVHAIPEFEPTDLLSNFGEEARW